MTDETFTPSAKLVSEACERFDRENEVVENALADLFAHYPANDNPSHVLLKVVALNALYSTRILAVLKVARHIHELGAKLDEALRAGSPEAVDWIANVTIDEKNLYYYSFASKYCNWHRPDLYPSYELRVERYLWFLKKREIFHSNALNTREDLWSYPTFCKVMNAFRDEFSLGAFNFKQIDKFLWSQAEAMAVAESEGFQQFLDTVPHLDAVTGQEQLSDSAQEQGAVTA